MNLNGLKTLGGRTVSRSVLVARKYSPEILTYGGLAGMGVAGFLAIKATLKLEPIVTDHESAVTEINDRKNVEEVDRKELVKVYTRTTLRVAKLYAPAFLTFAGSAVAIAAAHGIMRKRNVALVAAFKALESNFERYRERVKEQFGEDVDKDFYQGVTTEEIENEDGKKETVKKVSSKDISLYAKIFDETNRNWENDASINLMWLKAQELYLNQLLVARGHVFLNDVYDALGFERTRQGSIVGWVLSKDKDHKGDNEIDFGIYDLDSERARLFVNGDEKAILLDFNVDGVIWDKI